MTARIASANSVAFCGRYSWNIVAAAAFSAVRSSFRRLGSWPGDSKMVLMA